MKKTFNKTVSILFFATIITFLGSCEDKNEYFDWKAMNDDWLKEHRQDKGFTISKTGLCYKVIRKGNPADRNPNPTSYIKATYTGKLIDGTIFTEGEEVNMGRLNQTIKGMQEALLMMHTGDIYELYIPYNLGYGKTGSIGKIPPYSTLYFKIELIDSGL
ncbi:MAG: hypothetical protein CR965_00540 [Paludibacter sp.]|nr:MAG: hypothetical protein CR965_00540 [Paludibacter sp.]